MQRSSIVKIAVDRPYAEVLAFLDEPANFRRWATIGPDATMEHLQGRDYLVDLPRGQMAIRFSEPNPYGVLDYRVFEPGGEPKTVTPVRLYPNGDGAELILTWFQLPGVSDDQFDSEVAWIESDLLRLRTLLER